MSNGGHSTTDSGFGKRVSDGYLRSHGIQNCVDYELLSKAAGPEQQRQSIAAAAEAYVAA